MKNIFLLIIIAVVTSAGCETLKLSSFGSEKELTENEKIIKTAMVACGNDESFAISIAIEAGKLLQEGKKGFKFSYEKGLKEFLAVFSEGDRPNAQSQYTDCFHGTLKAQGLNPDSSLK